MSSSGPVSGVDLVTEWRPDYVTLAVAALVAVGYLRARRAAARTGLSWPWRRDLVFWLGMAAVVWTSSGFFGVRSTQLMWAWTAQQLLLLLVVPTIVLAGQPLSLLRRTPGRRSLVLTVLGSRFVRIVGHPLVGPVLVPIMCLLLFFTPLGQAAASSVWVAGLLHVGLLGIGVLIALPLVDRDDDRSSLAVGLALAVGFVELILDALPGIALRFQTHLRIEYFAVDRPTWSGSWLADQHTAGGILWIVAEVLDLPFLVLAATRWVKIDQREAARVDAELDARDAQRPPPQEGRPELDRPWWLDDPRFTDRFR